MPRIATVTEFRDYLALAGGSTQLLTNLLESAELMAERHARRRFSPFPTVTTGAGTAKTFRIRDGGMVPIPDLRSITSVTLDGYLLGADDYDLGDGFEQGYPATYINLSLSGRIASDFSRVPSLGGSYGASLVIVGHWGFNPPPQDVKHAVLIMASRAYRQRDASYADTLVSEGGGAISYFRQMPADAKAILDSYRKPLLAVA